MTFNEGDIVVLKSGGPQMTVNEIDGDICHCQWFDAKKSLMFGSFKESGLQAPKPRGAIAMSVGRR